MHPKIQEFAEKAGFYIEMFDDDNIENQKIEKFFDLIVEEFGSKATPNPWITQYPGDVFVVFNPITNGAHVLGAARSFADAEKILTIVL